MWQISGMTQEEIDLECKAIQEYAKELLADPVKAKEFFDKVLEGLE